MALLFISLATFEIILLFTIFGDSLSIRAKHLHTNISTPPPTTLTKAAANSTTNQHIPIQRLIFSIPATLSEITYAAYGLSVTLLTPVEGWLIDRYGEYMRYYLMFLGSILTILLMVWMGLSVSYPLLLVGYIFYPMPLSADAYSSTKRL